MITRKTQIRRRLNCARLRTPKYDMRKVAHLVSRSVAAEACGDYQVANELFDRALAVEEAVQAR